MDGELIVKPGEQVAGKAEQRPPAGWAPEGILGGNQKSLCEI